MMMIRQVLRQIPNTLTLSRIFLAIIFPFYHETKGIPLILIALVTEFLDGHLSRKFHWNSRFGQLMDPVADKIFFFSVTLTLLTKGTLTILQVLGLSIREIVVFLGVLFALGKRKKKFFLAMRPHLFGKITTAMQYIVFLNILLWPPLFGPLFGATFLFGTLSSWFYMKFFLQQIKKS